MLSSSKLSGSKKAAGAEAEACACRALSALAHMLLTVAIRAFLCSAGRPVTSSRSATSLAPVAEAAMGGSNLVPTATPRLLRASAYPSALCTCSDTVALLVAFALLLPRKVLPAATAPRRLSAAGPAVTWPHGVAIRAGQSGVWALGLLTTWLL
jgi:hypothetical protein